MARGRAGVRRRHGSVRRARPGRRDSGPQGPVHGACMMAMSRQWGLVGIIAAGLGLGAWAMVKFKPETDQVVVGSKLPDFKVVDLASNDSVSLHDRYKGTVTL